MRDNFKKIINLLERVIIPKDANIESPLVSLSLRHFKYNLNSTTSPLMWDIQSENSNKVIVITVKVDKRAMEEDIEIEEYLLNTLKNNKSFSDLVHALQQFEPRNSEVKNLYNLKTWKRTETTNQVVYSKTINFGELENNGKQ